MNFFDSQKKTQQFICRMVATGYCWWLAGIAKNKTELDARHAKYVEHYGCDLSPARKHYRKKTGLGNTQFVACATPPEILDGGYYWYLLATDGDGNIRDNTKLMDARTDHGRITWGQDYVLYEGTRPRGMGGGTRWSWYLKAQRQKELESYVGDILKTSPGELRGFFESQLRRPMHHGIRTYLTRLLKHAHHKFTRMYPRQPWPGRDPDKPLPIIAGYQ